MSHPYIIRKAAAAMILAILGVSVFGFAVFAHEMDDMSEYDCVAAKIAGGACPLAISNFAVHHAKALSSLFGAAFSSSALFWLSVLISLAVSFFATDRRLLKPPPAIRTRTEDFPRPPAKSAGAVLRWLSIFEHSPSF